ncbi:hypothetical protein GCM10027162_07740 [Streptomyces incanus]
MMVHCARGERRFHADLPVRRPSRRKPEHLDPPVRQPVRRRLPRCLDTCRPEDRSTRPLARAAFIGVADKQLRGIRE